jgi:hypothetical protein
MDEKRIEDSIIQHTQDRITAKFQNISSVPELIETVENRVIDLFENGRIKDLSKLIDPKMLNDRIEKAVKGFVERTIDDMMFDPKFMSRMQDIVTKKLTHNFTEHMKTVDTRGMVFDAVEEMRSGMVETVVKRTDKPGIVDNTTMTPALTLEDDVIVTSGHLATDSISTSSGADLGGDTSIHGALVIDGELAVKGRISLSNPSFKELSENIKNDTMTSLREDFIGETADIIREQIQDGINIKNILIRGAPLLNGNELSESIKITSIEALGTLKNLNVGTELSVANKRVGINTTAPTSALSVWDNEVTIDVGKRSENTAQIGTSKAQDLVLITNNQEQLKIDKDGLVSVNKLRIGRNRISTHHETPGWSGAKGDIVFNFNFKPDAAFAWICLGDFRWQELKSA